MRIVHLVRYLEEERVLVTAREQVRQGHEVTLLLLHDAVLSRPAFEGVILACRDDVVARGGQCPYPVVDYDGIVRLIGEHERVISW